MSEQLKNALGYVEKERNSLLSELKEIIAIESVSTDPAYTPEIEKAAEWLKKKLASIGIDNVQILPTGGHPVVYGEYLAAGPDAETMIVYGHYDVQPADPVEKWTTPAFDAQERDGNLYGRGTSDMKGQLMAAVFAIEAMLKYGDLPINIKFMIEGEEENTSPSLFAFLEENKDLLASDFALNSDAGMAEVDLPTITYGMRGLLSCEIHVQGPGKDLHSGLYGGAVRNPIHELARLIGKIHDENGRITLPGFYDKVRDLDDEEREALARLPIDEKNVLAGTGAQEFWGEAGYSFVERVGARPAIDINGIFGGYTGAGTKTVLPAEAHAKLTMRLVPDQDPDEVLEQLKRFLDENIYGSNTWSLDFKDGATACTSGRDSNGVRAMQKAFESVWGMEPVFYRSGGSIPAVGYMQEVLGVESVLTGFSRPDDNVHSPNEKLHLETWYKGIDTFIHFLHNMAGS